jgi:hypothetical protein
MLRTNLWNDSVSRVVLDHRSREAHLQLERLERLLVPRAAVVASWFRRLLCPFPAPTFMAARGERAGRWSR